MAGAESKGDNTVKNLAPYGTERGQWNKVIKNKSALFIVYIWRISVGGIPEQVLIHVHVFHRANLILDLFLAVFDVMSTP